MSQQWSSRTTGHSWSLCALLCWSLSMAKYTFTILVDRAVMNASVRCSQHPFSCIHCWAQHCSIKEGMLSHPLPCKIFVCRLRPGHLLHGLHVILRTADGSMLLGRWLCCEVGDCRLIRCKWWCTELHKAELGLRKADSDVKGILKEVTMWMLAPARSALYRSIWQSQGLIENQIRHGCWVCS